jgi:hypothetical protein
MMKRLPISGHGPESLRVALQDAVYDENDRALWRLTGKLWNCSDIMPGEVCAQACVPRGSSYAQFAREFREGPFFRGVDASGNGVYLTREQFVKSLHG